MRAHYLQHVPFEGLGSIEAWLNQRSYQISRTALYESTDFPELMRSICSLLWAVP